MTFTVAIEDTGKQVILDWAARNGGPTGSSSSEGNDDGLAYSNAIKIYLSFARDKAAEGSTSACTWSPLPTKLHVVSTFGRQTLPMAWDFAEANVFADSSGNIQRMSELVASVLARNCALSQESGYAEQIDACRDSGRPNQVISTDPPYYDNIGYADLSDFFYAWLRLGCRGIYPELFTTLSTPKADELVALPYRHDSKAKAEDFFLGHMSSALEKINNTAHQGFPITIYYAFKQSETKLDSGRTSTGWETFLDAVVKSGLEVCGTWPVRTERSGGFRNKGQNALASSVVLVCQKRLDTALVLSRSDFRRQLRQELPKAMKELERATIAPVDLAQAAIGPGMAIFSSAKAVLNPDDSAMSVKDALIEINASLDEYLSQDEGELDADSRFALTFFESSGYKERDFGDAEGLAKARNLSVAGVAQAGILRSIAGKVRLLPRAELPEDWDPASDKRLSVWEATQQLIKRLEAGGEDKAAELLLQLKSIAGHGDLAANCRALAYRLYNHCEKTKQAEEARAYNGLVIAWPELEKRAAASSAAPADPQQLSMV